MENRLSVISSIERNIQELHIDNIKEQLGNLLSGYKVTCPIYDPGVFLYRARMFNDQFTKNGSIKLSDLVYPPNNKAKIGRLNREGQSMFYASFCKEALYYEIGELSENDEFVVTFWKTKNRMMLNNIGYTDFAFEKLGAKRKIPNFNLSNNDENVFSIQPNKSIDPLLAAVIASDQSHDINEAFSLAFTKKINHTNEYFYKLTTAIAEMHLGEIINYNVGFSGIIYPSIKMWANADNVALLPNYVDDNLEFKKATHVRVEGRDGDAISFKYLDEARSFDNNGCLIWLGRIGRWNIEPGQMAHCTARVGTDEYGDYTIGENGDRLYWHVTDSISNETIFTD